ncbi:MAG: DUF3365 domain-containing protein [Hyphomicrobiaceae bacterium]
MGPYFRAVSLAWAIVGLAAAGSALAQKDKPGDAALRLAKARDVVQTLSDRLRLEITLALKAGPAANAIGVCQTTAPGLTSALADETGVELLRVSHKLRNPENAPDDFEDRVLQKFQAKLDSGAEIAKLEHSEIVVTAEGDKLFRYMRAIPVQEQCLVCHGTDVKQDVKAEIARLYPEDKAIGYKLGELRGAFSLIQIIEE